MKTIADHITFVFQYYAQDSTINMELNFASDRYSAYRNKGPLRAPFVMLINDPQTFLSDPWNYTSNLPASIKKELPEWQLIQ